jgi:hypothetical protein
MPGIVSDATKIWEENQSWAQNAQCATWDPSGRRVEVWECIREHASNKINRPPNENFWRFLVKR